MAMLILLVEIASVLVLFPMFTELNIVKRRAYTLVVVFSLISVEKVGSLKRCLFSELVY